MSFQGPFRYTLTSPDFYVNENTGIVYTKNGNLDFEQKKEYMLSVQVKDRGNKASQLQAKVQLIWLFDWLNFSIDIYLVLILHCELLLLIIIWCIVMLTIGNQHIICVTFVILFIC